MFGEAVRFPGHEFQPGKWCDDQFVAELFRPGGVDGGSERVRVKFPGSGGVRQAGFPVKGCGSEGCIPVQRQFGGSGGRVAAVEHGHERIRIIAGQSSLVLESSVRLADGHSCQDGGGELAIRAHGIAACVVFVAVNAAARMLIRPGTQAAHPYGAAA